MEYQPVTLWAKLHHIFNAGTLWELGHSKKNYALVAEQKEKAEKLIREIMFKYDPEQAAECYKYEGEQ